MSDQTTILAAAVDDVLAEIEARRAAQDLRAAHVGRMRSVINLAAILAYQREVALAADQLAQLALNGAPAETVVPALQAAAEEGRRILTLLGIDLTASDGGF